MYIYICMYLYKIYKIYVKHVHRQITVVCLSFWKSGRADKAFHIAPTSPFFTRLFQQNSTFRDAIQKRYYRLLFPHVNDIGSAERLSVYRERVAIKIPLLRHSRCNPVLSRSFADLSRMEMSRERKHPSRQKASS